MEERFIENLRRFYESHRGELYTYALVLTGQREMAEDVIHTVFCKVLRRGRAPRELRPYVFRSIRNAAIDERRAREPRNAPLPIFQKGEGVRDLALLVQLEGALASLGVDEREAIVLRLCNDMTLREIAQTRRVSINTVASWYRRGMEKLKNKMQEIPDE